MISSIIESFKAELEKEETQEYIVKFIDPFIRGYRLYFYIVLLLLFIMTMSSVYSTFLIFKSSQRT